MNTLVPVTAWLQLLALLAVEVGLIALAVALAAALEPYGGVGADVLPRGHHCGAGGDGLRALGARQGSWELGGGGRWGGMGVMREEWEVWPGWGARGEFLAREEMREWLWGGHAVAAGGLPAVEGGHLAAAGSGARTVKHWRCVARSFRRAGCPALHGGKMPAATARRGVLCCASCGRWARRS